MARPPGSHRRCGENGCRDRGNTAADHRDGEAAPPRPPWAGWPETRCRRCGGAHEREARAPASPGDGPRFRRRFRGGRARPAMAGRRIDGPHDFAVSSARHLDEAPPADRAGAKRARAARTAQGALAAPPAAQWHDPPERPAGRAQDARPAASRPRSPGPDAPGAARRSSKRQGAVRRTCSATGADEIRLPGATRKGVREKKIPSPLD